MPVKPISIFIAATLLTGSVFAFGPSPSGDQPDQQVLLRRFDLNQDHYISQEEAANAPELKQQWDSLDSNRDGRLDQAEFTRFNAKGMAAEQKP